MVNPHWLRWLQTTLFPPGVAVDRRTVFLDRVSIGLIAFEWLFFGSLHFARPDLTLDEMPYWLPLKPLLGSVSGLLEITTGTLVLIPITRRLAASLSLFLLIVLTPAMGQIMTVNSALPPLPAPLPALFRAVLIPNNIYLALLSIYLWRHPDATLVAFEPSRLPAAEPRSSVSSRRAIPLITAAILLAANCAGFSTLIGNPGSRGHLAEASLWAMMCLAAGGLVGFLFAVPRVNARAGARATLSTNTNIETVSDWVTKTLVGLGLVNFSAIVLRIGALAGQLSLSLAVSANFALALLVYFFIAGLIEGYLITRTFLVAEFRVEESVASGSLADSGPTSG